MPVLAGGTETGYSGRNEEPGKIISTKKKLLIFHFNRLDSASPQVIKYIEN